MKRSVLLIDNLDSFTFNLVEAFQRLGCSVHTMRNSIPAGDAFAKALRMDALIVLSPGPGGPLDAGCCLELIAMALGKLPLLGICLGHQAIVQQAGGRVERAQEPVHGKASLLQHDGAGPMEGIESPTRIARYHSLCTKLIPNRFTVHATIDEMAMVISDGKMRQTGIQFHPESILTAQGDRMLANIIRTSF